MTWGCREGFTEVSVARKTSRRQGAALVRDVHHVKLARAMRMSSPEGRENSAGCNHWIGLRENRNRKPMGFYHQLGFR